MRLYGPEVMLRIQCGMEKMQRGIGCAGAAGAFLLHGQNNILEQKIFISGPIAGSGYVEPTGTGRIQITGKNSFPTIMGCPHFTVT